MPPRTDSVSEAATEFSAARTPTVVTPALLREWPLPEPGGSKYGRGQVLVIGGARQTPGAASLAGLSALRVGAGRLTMAVAESVAIALAVAIPEAGVVGLPEGPHGSVLGSSGAALASSLERADAVLVGSGLDDPQETAAVLRDLLDRVGPETRLVLDAFALGVLGDIEGVADTWGGRLVLTPNLEEASRLIGTDDAPEDIVDATVRIAEKYRAVVSCKGCIADPDGRVWQVATGYSGLGTSGSGDVLAGAVAGLLARGAAPAQSACWATHVHAAAGDRLSADIGTLGYLARELVDKLPVVLSELDT